jgi:hypothetical protein
MPKVVRSAAPHLVEELSRIRAAIVQEADRSSLRAVARDVGMTPSGLQGFLDGANPYGRTGDRLRAWYYQWQNGRGLTPETADEMLRMMIRRIPDPKRAMPRVVQALVSIHDQERVRLPPWLAALHARYRSPTPPASPPA